MRARFDDRAEKVIALTESGKIGSHGIESGMGARLVVGPGRATEIEERFEMDDHA